MTHEDYMRQALALAREAAAAGDVRLQLLNQQTAVPH